MILSSVSDDPSGGLADILTFSMLGHLVHAKFTRESTEIGFVWAESRRTCGALIVSREASSSHDGLQKHRLLFHAPSFPQARPERQPCGFQTAPLPVTEIN